MSNIPAHEFDSLIKQFFSFLIDEYHFALKKKNDLGYDFETATTRISVFVEYNRAVVGMVPIGEEDRKLRQKNILPEQLCVTVVAKGVDPNFHYEVDWDEPIASSMERQSLVIKNYCKDFLAGDFTKWTDVLAEMKKSK
jgi:hypothetical protein